MSIAIVVLAIVLLLVLISRFKLNPFFAFLVVSILAGICLNIPLSSLPKAIEKGLGEMLGALTIIIVLGTCLGKLTAESGAAAVIANKLINIFGTNNLKFALMVAGLFIGIPMFYSVGFILLVPLVFTLAKKHNINPLPLAMPMLASLSVAHGFLPPHPSPVALISQLHADMALTLVYGLIVAIPCILIAGMLWSNFMPKIQSNPHIFDTQEISKYQLPTFSNSIFTALMPVFILLICYFLKYFFVNPNIQTLLSFIGNPSMVLILSFFIAIYTIGIKLKMPMEKIMSICAEAIKDVAPILLILAGAGIFKEILMQAGIDKSITNSLNGIPLHPFLLAWLIAAFIRVLIGSATVAGLLTATIVAPLVLNNPSIDKNLLILAIGAGSLIGSHVNDGGFWIFKEYFNLSVKETLQTWTIMESLVSVVGIITIFILNFCIN